MLDSSEDDLLVWSAEGGSTINEARLADRLSLDQRASLQGVLDEFVDVFQDKPGRTSVIEHTTETGSAQPMELPPYVTANLLSGCEGRTRDNLLRNY